MKVLFLDDDVQRLGKAKGRFAEDDLDIAETAGQAIMLLKMESPYDLVHLDHDLGGKVYCPSDDNSGYAVAKFIATLPKDKLPKQVVIHSCNPTGAENMFNVLNGVCPVVRQPFRFGGVRIRSRGNLESLLDLT